MAVSCPLVIAAVVSGCDPAPAPTPTPTAVACPIPAEQPDLTLAVAEPLIGRQVVVCPADGDVPSPVTLTADWAQLLAVDGAALPAHPELVAGQGAWSCRLADGVTHVLVQDEWYAARPVECSQAL
jgi:hypothetical protein